MELRSKKKLVTDFINSVSSKGGVNEEWHKFTEESKKSEIESLIKEEKLKPEKAETFINKSIENGEVSSAGTELADILPPMNMFAKDRSREKKKSKVLGEIRTIVEKYLGL